MTCSSLGSTKNTGEKKKIFLIGIFSFRLIQSNMSSIISAEKLFFWDGAGVASSNVCLSY